MFLDEVVNGRFQKVGWRLVLGYIMRLYASSPFYVDEGEKLIFKGVFNIPQPSGEELITRLLDLILKQDDPERSFVKFKEGDDLVLLVNNQGGMSALEMGAVVDETLTQLGMSIFSLPNRDPLSF